MATRHPNLDRRLLDVVRPVLAGEAALTVRIVHGEERLALFPVRGQTVSPKGRVLSRALSCDVAAWVAEGFDTGADPGSPRPVRTTPDEALLVTVRERPRRARARRDRHPSTQAVLDALTAEPATVVELAEATGLEPERVRDHANNLVGAGLAERGLSPRPPGQGGRPRTTYALVTPTEAEA